VERLVCLGLDNNIEYVNRLIDELEQIEQRHMQSVIKHVIFLVDDFMNREVVFGVGRGSSCSSLVMFLIGINQVDPVKYNIDMEEFFKPI
jgi:DNA polymerase-3 subunit alpha